MTEDTIKPGACYAMPLPGNFVVRAYIRVLKSAGQTIS